jgi:hypothetical protein
MRRLVLACFFLPAIALTSCSSAQGPGASDGPLGAAQSAIAYGTPDATHTAVVSLLGNAGGGSFDECSGTIVQVKGGQGYVLTAAHCCNKTVPSVVVMSNDYTVGEQYLFGGTPSPPAYAVTQGSVYYDTAYNGQDHDFCMLQFAAPSGAAVIPVAQPGQDGLSLGVDVEHVGFGVTDTSTTNSGRRTATAPVDQSLTTLILQSSQGGPNHIPGVCEGDSGGPALVPAGAPQSQQTVVATTSFGDNSSCAQNTMNVCSRVTSETGPGGFITNYLAGTPSGTQAGSAQAMCQQCASAAEMGACQSQTQACVADQACLNLNTCVGMCTTQTCISQCETTAGSKAVSELSALNTCICNTACTSQCSGQCTSSSGCGVTTNNATCDQCLDADCCSQAQACVADATCNGCLVPAPAASCNTDALYMALNSCVNGSCGASCGGSTTASSSSSTSGASTSNGSSTSSSASSGAGGGTSSTGSVSTSTTTSGAGPTGAGTSGSGSSGAGGAAGTGGSSTDGTPSQSSGCSVMPGGAPEPGPLAGLVVGAAYALSRKRRRGSR